MTYHFETNHQELAESPKPQKEIQSDKGETKKEQVSFDNIDNYFNFEKEV